MSMSTHVYGFRPPDEKWQKMKAIYDSYVAAGLEVLPDIQKFFGWEEPSEQGARVDLPKECLRQFNDGEAAQEGIEVLLDQLPENIAVIRFVISW